MSFGNTRFILSLLSTTAKGALVRISLAYLYSVLTVSALVLSGLLIIAHVILAASLGSGCHYYPHFTDEETEPNKCK